MCIRRFSVWVCKWKGLKNRGVLSSCVMWKCRVDQNAGQRGRQMQSQGLFKQTYGQVDRQAEQTGSGTQEHKDEMQHMAKRCDESTKNKGKRTDIYSGWLMGKWREESRWTRWWAEYRQVCWRGWAGNQENEEGRTTPTDTNRNTDRGPLGAQGRGNTRKHWGTSKGTATAMTSCHNPCILAVPRLFEL